MPLSYFVKSVVECFKTIFGSNMGFFTSRIVSAARTGLAFCLQRLVLRIHEDYFGCSCRRRLKRYVSPWQCMDAKMHSRGHLFFRDGDEVFFFPLFLD